MTAEENLPPAPPLRGPATPKMITRVWCLFEHNPRDHHQFRPAKPRLDPVRARIARGVNPAPRSASDWRACQCTAMPDGANWRHRARPQHTPVRVCRPARRYPGGAGDRGDHRGAPDRPGLATPFPTLYFGPPRLLAVEAMEHALLPCQP